MTGQEHHSRAVTRRGVHAACGSGGKIACGMGCEAAFSHAMETLA